MATLQTYKQKRNFEKTPEPSGKVSKGSKNRFVIQKHDARRLHYDLRLELDGIYKSWAVTKGPSLVPGEKRLAVHVEDHPLDYGTFEGTIPKGEYGGGSVIVWDNGTWQPLNDVHKSYAKGHLDFELRGQKLQGRWHLVKMHQKSGDKRENWLLIKADDEAARSSSDPDILEEQPESVKSGKHISDIDGKTAKTAKANNSEPYIRTKKAALPDFVEPALATLVKSPPAGKNWLHEIKFDGYRLEVRIEAGRIKLLTRSGLDWTKKFDTKLLADFQSLPAGKALIDGELVVENEHGASDFSALQADLSEGRSDRFYFYAFDLLYLDTDDLRELPLHQRKEMLKKLLEGITGHVRYSDHFEDPASMVLRHACRLSLEGVVSKDRNATYVSGRSRSWLKSKCSARQEFVVAGYIPSTVSRKAIGSLVLGVHEGSKLRHVGRVGTGFSNKLAEELFEKLERLRTEVSPFAKKLAALEAHNVKFVEPKLVAEVEFRAWTGDGNLRHASFRGLREDKLPETIVREKTGKTATSKPAAINVKLTHPDRIYWPDQGITKEGLANYYTDVWKYMAPFIVNRPLALVRCPKGIKGQQFFQKHGWKGINSRIALVNDPKDKNGEPFIAINDIDGLISLAQSAALEVHPWGSTLANWEKPDILIFDLDPGENVGWEEVIAAAHEARERLKKSGLASFVKTSGGKGLHVVVPLEPKAQWPAVKTFCKNLAVDMAADSPKLYVSTIAKSKRAGKILIDYLRNQRGMTAVAPYSPRARASAAVSMPLAWDELSPAIGPAYFTIENAMTRLSSLSKDPWGGFRAAAKPLPLK